MARHESSTFFAPVTIAPGDIASAIGGTGEKTTRATRRWFDTFDWDLWHAGMVLEVDEEASGRSVAVLRGRDDHQPRWTQVVSSVPQCRDDLPPGPWRRDLADLLGVRALVTVAEAQIESTDIVVTDGRDKRVAMVRIEAFGPGRDDPTTWLRVVPVRGYEAQASAVTERLIDVDGVVPTHTHPLASFTVGDRTPGSSGTEVRLRLEPEVPAVHAVADMLRSFHWVMTTLEPWLVGAPDTEFLHDWRVALRRSRSVLKLAKGIVRTRDLDTWRPRLRDLQQRSGDLRDLDVFVLEFDSYLTLVPSEFLDDLEPLHELVLSRRTSELARFERYIDSRDHERLRSEYAVFIDRLAHAEPEDEVSVGAGDASRPIGEVGRQGILRAHRRVLRRGRRIGPDSPPQDLHEVRIATKEFRYAIELHSSLLDPQETKALLKRLKSLQDLLGGFQDAEAHAAQLEEFAEAMVADDAAPVPARTLMAIGLLSQAFTDKNADVRARFDVEFEHFDSRETRQRLDAALGAGGER